MCYFKGLTNFYLNKNFHDLILEVMHLDVSIITLTIILSHIIVVM